MTDTADNWNNCTDLNFVKISVNTILMKINWEGRKVLLESKNINSIYMKFSKKIQQQSLDIWGWTQDTYDVKMKTCGQGILWGS